MKSDRSRGLKERFGDLLRENGSMLELREIMGFRENRMLDEPSAVRVSRQW
jgi:hypothetical protein